MQNWSKTFLVVGIFGAFALAILLLLFGASERLMSLPIIMLGLAFIIEAEEAASTAVRPDVVRIASLGTRTESSIRPFTVVLWGCGVVLGGLLQLLGF